MSKLPRWLPAVLVMAAIFLFSATPSSSLPNYGFWDSLFKKGGHLIGYAMLALAYWRWLGLNPRRAWLAWLLAVLYAFTDEFHQSFTPGRSASLWDVLIYDNLGAALGVLAGRWFQRRKTL